MWTHKISWRPLHRMPFDFNAKKRKRDAAKAKAAAADDEDEEDTGDQFLLNRPKTDLIDNFNTTTSCGLEAGHCSMQGYRRQMEDQHIIENFDLANHTLVAVMDGHAGDGTSNYVSVRLREVIEETDDWQNYVKEFNKIASASTSTSASASASKSSSKGGGAKANSLSESCLNLLKSALNKAYISLDAELRSLEFLDASGSTCVCAVITPSHIICANLGDSRCYIGSDGKAIAMSEDHKPNNPEEKERIVKNGGFVEFDRVNGCLAMSRALGDFEYKKRIEKPIHEQLVIPVPDITVHVRNHAKDEFLLLACDGIWDVMDGSDALTYFDQLSSNSKEVDDVGAKYLKLTSFSSLSSATCEALATALIYRALGAGSTDNLSALVVKLKK